MAWVHCLGIAPFLAVKATLSEWTDQVSDRVGCYELLAPVAAVPRMALTDSSCPMITIAHQLRAVLGWVPCADAIGRENVDTKRFDGRDPRSRKL